MKRERVIVDIANLGQASKIEDTVKTGYCDVINDYILHWIAVEEDLTESYRKLAEQSGDSKIKETMKKFAEESVQNARTLRELHNSFDALGVAKINRYQVLEELQQKST